MFSHFQEQRVKYYWNVWLISRKLIVKLLKNIKMKHLRIMFYNFWIEMDKNCQCVLGTVVKWSDMSSTMIGVSLVCLRSLRHSKLKAMIDVAEWCHDRVYDYITW